MTKHESERVVIALLDRASGRIRSKYSTYDTEAEAERGLDAADECCAQYRPHWRPQVMTEARYERMTNTGRDS